MLKVGQWQTMGKGVCVCVYVCVFTGSSIPDYEFKTMDEYSLHLTTRQGGLTGECANQATHLSAH